MLNTATPLPHPLWHYYQNNYIATVRIENGKIYALEGKKSLIKAKQETKECYVKDYDTGEELKLVLKGARWVVGN